MTVKPPPTPSDRHLDAFRQSLARLEEADGLFQSSLLISAIQFPEMESGWWNEWHRVLGELSDRTAERLGTPKNRSERERLELFVEHFTQDLGFTGNTEDYHAPENSCLTHVIERRRGLPITLSIVMTSLGRRIGFDIFGVGTPGHFLTGARVGGELYLMDPFNGSPLMDIQTAATLIHGLVGISIEDALGYMKPATNPDILLRMLNNLKVSYMNKTEVPRLMRTLDWLLEVDPDNLIERRNRGLLLMQAGNVRRAAADLLRYLESDPNAEELELIYNVAAQAKEELGGEE